MASVSAVFNKLPPAVSQKFQKIQEMRKTDKWHIIEKVAVASLTELAVSMAFVGVTCCFVATPGGIPLLIGTAAAIIAVNTGVRCLNGYLSYYLKQNQHRHSANLEFLKKMQMLCNYITPMTFSILDSTTRNVVIHEGGHALAAALLFENSKPIITVKPHQGGMTQFMAGGLTRMGEFFGRDNSRLIVTAAGPALAILTSTIQIGVAHKLHKSHPMLSRYLYVSAIVSIAEHVFYALTSFIASYRTPGHDFVALWLGGIHPAVSIIAMVALPIIVKTGFFLYDQARERYAQHKLERRAALAN